MTHTQKQQNKKSSIVPNAREERAAVRASLDYNMVTTKKKRFCSIVSSAQKARAAARVSIDSCTATEQNDFAPSAKEERAAVRASLDSTAMIKKKKSILSGA